MDDAALVKLVRETSMPDRTMRWGVVTLVALFLAQIGMVAGTAFALKLFTL